MSAGNFNISEGKPVILLSPLDWGLGHASRCIPLICELLLQGCEVIIASKNGPKSLLMHEFPELTFLPVSGYNVQYSRNRSFLPMRLFTQIPKLLYSINTEHKWLKKAVKNGKIDAIISDNRMGFYHSEIPSIYITHQLHIKTGNSFTERLADKIHHSFIKKYSVCWVPDFGGDVNLAGELSHPKEEFTKPVYLGCLSRFEKKENVAKQYELVVIISGPEPQRTVFENILYDQLNDYDKKVLFVRGLPGNDDVKKHRNNLITVVNHLAADELNLAMQQCNYVISRSGYTTIMDLVKLQQRAILVPTPGQTEQEYLAKNLCERKMFYSEEQNMFSLKEALKKAEIFPFAIPSFDMEQYKKVIAEFVQSLKKGH